jgi:hypothetical protein
MGTDFASRKRYEAKILAYNCHDLLYHWINAQYNMRVGEWQVGHSYVEEAFEKALDTKPVTTAYCIKYAV